MNSLLAFLLRNGAGILKDGAEVLIGQALIRAITQKLKGLIIFYTVAAVFAMAALVFLYVLIYRFLTSRLDDISAAAIMCGANLLLIMLMVAGRAIFKPKPVAETAVSPIVALLKSHAEGLGGKDMNFDAGIAIGNRIGRQLRKATPQIALAAAVLGLIVGVRPQILGLGRRRQPPAKKP
jgi:hypothetical protein